MFKFQFNFRFFHLLLASAELSLHFDATAKSLFRDNLELTARKSSAFDNEWIRVGRRPSFKCVVWKCFVVSIVLKCSRRVKMDNEKTFLTLSVDWVARACKSPSNGLAETICANCVTPFCYFHFVVQMANCSHSHDFLCAINRIYFARLFHPLWWRRMDMKSIATNWVRNKWTMCTPTWAPFNCDQSRNERNSFSNGNLNCQRAETDAKQKIMGTI